MAFTQLAEQTKASQVKRSGAEVNPRNARLFATALIAGDIGRISAIE